MGKKQTGFRFSDQTKERLEQLASKKELSQNSILVILINKEFERVFGLNNQPVASGVTDVSS